jgi:hypothetical protein
VAETHGSHVEVADRLVEATSSHAASGVQQFAVGDADQP